MITIFNLIKYITIFTLFLCCQIQAMAINNDIKDVNFNDAIDELFSNQQYRRASLRYHPHILYKKASLKPLIGHNGKFIFMKQD